MKKYSYKNINKKDLKIELTEEQSNIVIQAEKDFATSNRHIRTQEFHIWRGALKAYHLSTYDRKVQLGEDSWKQNITIGLIRSFVDILVASLNEKPLSFVGTAFNEKGAKNKDNIIKTLNYISDISGFHTQLKETMANGLIVGEIAMRVGYKKTNNKETYVSIIGDSAIEEVVETEERNHPYAVNVSIFNIFPDPYSGPLRYVTERGVVPYSEFIEVFGGTLRSKKNKSPLGKEDFIKLLPINENGADLQDYGNITNQIHEKVNEEFARNDYYLMPGKTKSDTISGTTQDEDPDVTAGLIEFKATWYNGRLVILANNYPVYIGENPYGFIPYVVKAANNTKARFGEGIPYMLKGLEEVGNSFICNYFDSARSIANPTMVAQKNLMIDDDQLEDGTPGGVIYTEDNLNGNVVYRLDKGGLNDFNILPIIQQIASQITGISEYDLGQAARERTATGALAVTESSQKRMSPYVSNFLDAISIVAQMWLKLAKKYRSEKQMIYILDEDGEQTWEEIKKADLIGGLNISLEAEGIFGANEAIKHQKAIDLYNTLSGSGFADSPELAKEIIKTAGYAASRFITAPGEGIKPDNADKIDAVRNQTGLPGINSPVGGNQIANNAGQAVTPNIDLGNGGQGNPNT